MMLPMQQLSWESKISLFLFSVLVLFFGGTGDACAAEPASMNDFASMPISIAQNNIIPQVQINASNDHQLFFKAYNDYSDLDDDGIPETTYKHSIEYYGYFDSYKCYVYDTVNKRFSPDLVTNDKYCTSGANQWSGNFLNWASMTRIDAVRKILFGGHRRIDTKDLTVLERAHLPTDIHAFAKYYDGQDLDKLTPFAGVEAYGISATSRTINKSDNVSYLDAKSFVVPDVLGWNKLGDFVTIVSLDNENVTIKGWISSIDPLSGSISLDVQEVKNDSGISSFTSSNWGVTNNTRSGITLCNVTFAPSGFSELVTDSNPPLIRVAEGNYSFWAAGEVRQCVWEEEDPELEHGKNYNDPLLSGIYAAQDDPWKNGDGRGVGLGEIDYVAKVEACVDMNGDGVLDSNDGRENCKLYPYGNYKPKGLLQEYGETPRLHFGMIAGTYGKSTRGGDMIMPLFMKNDAPYGMCREINLGKDCNDDGTIDDFVDSDHAEGDGTFSKIYNWIGGTQEKQYSEGLINSWSIYRIKGYKYGDWTYADTSGDKCANNTINFFGDSSTSECRNWGNPFAEIYLVALRHWIGENAPVDYQASDNDKGVFQGLNYLNGVWEDPLKEDNYCAPLNIINFNSSTISADTAFDKQDDELDTSSQGLVKDLDSPFSAVELTNQIGQAEGIHDTGKTWFVGETKTDGSKTCTAKSISELGEVRGLCPEGPGLAGGYLIAGMAWYAHTNDIRPDSINNDLKGSQTVNNYSVRLSSGSPIIDIPVPGVDQKVTIIPSCIDNNKDNYGCTLVDFKIVEPHKEEIIGGVKTGKGKFLAIWEDSLQGSDYDLDAGGIYEYEITADNIKVTTGITLQNLDYAIGHGYVISGTNQDGLHIHSGVNQFEYNDPVSGILDCPSNNRCDMADGLTSQNYTLGSSSAELLEDPLWYAAKWGGFEDKNDNKLPDLQEEWDVKDNKTGDAVPDGVPDNYFFASHPKELEDSIRRTFDAILERKSSGTAAAVVSSNVRGEGALYQAYYQPLQKDGTNEANWVGTVQSLWLDRYGLSRQDCGGETDGNATENPRGYNPTTKSCVTPTLECVPNGRLDNYCVDQVVETFYDTIEERTRVKVFHSTEPEKFEAFSMQGVVESFSAGNVVMVPNSLEGLTTFSAGTLEINPYYLEGTVISYDEVTGDVAISVADWQGPAGETHDQWLVENTSAIARGKSTSLVTFAANTNLSLTVEPVGAWISVGDVLRLQTKKVVGRLGESFSSWDVECVDGTTASTYVFGTSIELDNSSSSSLTVPDDFGSCIRAKISTYNMRGVAGAVFDDWSVANLDTILGRSSSQSSLTLSNSGSKAYSVADTLNWLEAGDRVLVSNYETKVIELDDVSHLWNAREKLYLPGVSTADLQFNRDYNNESAAVGRYITTWVDSNLDGIADASEYRSFDRNMLSADVPYGFFKVADQNTAQNVVDYIRGVEVSGMRNRTVKYDLSDSTTNVMRLGDIVNSTPTVVGTPQEGFDLLYSDNSFKAFRQQYQDRRVVVYTGGNDGLLHAFNGGFYNEVEVDGEKQIEYSVNGKDPLNPAVDAIAHPLGSELWAYAPYNLLPHLQWLTDPQYTDSHVSFIDGKPRVFDANIFASKNDPDTYPNGWGTVMVVGMRLGGGAIEIDTLDDDGTVGGGTADNKRLRSAYIIFDITNPEKPPELLGELPIPDGSFTTVYPAVAAFRDVMNKNCGGSLCNKWYLLFGTGPNDLHTYESNQSAKMYLFELEQLVTGTPATITTIPSECSLDTYAENSASPPYDVEYKMMSCDTAFTGLTNTFIGNPTVVDWDLDFYADASYFGLAGNSTATTGSIMKFDFKNDEDPAFWENLEHFYQTDKPVIVQPVPAFDNRHNKWIFFGTGRYYATADKTSVAEQSLFGIKDDETGTPYPPQTGPSVLDSEIMDTSDIEVYSDGALETPVFGISGNEISTFDALVSEMDTYATGWQMDLPPIFGTLGVDPATRNVTNSALLGGVLFSSVFQPSLDPCIGEGNSRLYGLFYKTGTAYPSPSVFGSTIFSKDGDIKYRSNKFTDLGIGFATTPSIHSGSGTGDEGVRVFTQLSTGDIVQSGAGTVESVRTGRMSWGQR